MNVTNFVRVIAYIGAVSPAFVGVFAGSGQMSFLAILAGFTGIASACAYGLYCGWNIADHSRMSLIHATAAYQSRFPTRFPQSLSDSHTASGQLFTVLRHLMVQLILFFSALFFLLVAASASGAVPAGWVAAGILVLILGGLDGYRAGRITDVESIMSITKMLRAVIWHMPKRK
jgi:hypothetical protein